MTGLLGRISLGELSDGWRARKQIRLNRQAVLTRSVQEYRSQTDQRMNWFPVLGLLVGCYSASIYHGNHTGNRRALTLIPLNQTPSLENQLKRFPHVSPYRNPRPIRARCLGLGQVGLIVGLSTA